MNKANPIDEETLEIVKKAVVSQFEEILSSIGILKIHMDQIEAGANYKGWNDCLSAVRASLKNYPNTDVDVEIGESIEAIVKKANNSACKEMLEACASLVSIIEQLIPEPSARGVADVVLAQARAAIAKAEE